MNKRVKTLLSLSLACVMSFSLTACKTGKNDDSLSDAISKNYEAGTWSENVYQSDFLNTTITVPNNYTAATEDEIAKEKQNVIIDSKTSSDASQEEIERGIFYELKVTSDISNADMNIIIKDMDIIYSIAYSEEDYMQSFSESIKQINMDTMKISSMSEPKWITLGGNEYYMIQIGYSYNKTMNTYQRIYLRKIGTYMETLTMSVVNENEFTEMENMFTTAE